MSKSSSLTVYKRPSGNWAWRFSAGMVDGKRVQPSKGGFKTKAEAVADGNKAFQDWLHGGETKKQTEMSVTDFFNHWVEAYATVNCKDTTVENYQKKLRLYIIPEIGNYKLTALKPSRLQTLINDLCKRGLSRNTLAVVKGILTGGFDYAVVTDGYLKSSPMIGVKLPSKRSEIAQKMTKKNRHAISVETWEKIIERFPETHPAHIPLVMGYKCGLRLGESFGLLWSDIDLKNKKLKVQRQIQNVKGVWVVKHPKYDSYRTIDLDSETVELLKREKIRQNGFRLACGEFWHTVCIDGEQFDVGTGEQVRPLCVRSDGTYCTPRIMQNVGRVVHGKTGTEAISVDFDYHSLRHTHCTQLLSNGAPVKSVQERLGHKNIETTLNIYAECTEQMRSKTIDVIESLYKK